MHVHYFDLAQLAASPWKNGGGTTREIVCYPLGASLDSFDWRVSVANIASSGPFSAFSGVDRQIMLLDGDGVHLRGEGIDHKLDVPYQPFAFSGDAPLDCAMLGGASTDFNVMTRRGRWRADLRVLRDASEAVASQAGLLMVLEGEWQLANEMVSKGQGVWWEEAATWHVKPVGASAVIAVLRLTALYSM
jgi:environmental stress-induced protein Ves